MILRYYCLKDKLTKEFKQPFICENDDVAIRSFKVWAYEDKSIPDSIKIDYSLWFVGTFETEDASFKNFGKVKVQDCPPILEKEEIIEDEI